MTRVRLPDGCTGLDMANGTRYDADAAGGTVDVASSDARYINTSWYGQSGVMRGAASFTFATKGGRYCPPCNRTWNAWSADCPKCGQPTDPIVEERT